MVHNVLPRVVCNGTPLWVMPSVEMVIQGFVRTRFAIVDLSAICLGVIMVISNSLVKQAAVIFSSSWPGRPKWQPNHVTTAGTNDLRKT